MKTKIAQGYNPDRVTVEELGKGYRLVPRRYLDRSKYDLADMAQAWTGSEWVSDLDWADEDDSHRTLLSNAQLGMMHKKRVDVEAPPLSIAAEPPSWRKVTEAEILVLRGHREKVDVEKFRHFGGRMSGYFTCPANHYTTTLTPVEIEALAWRPITEAERLKLREADESKFDWTKFRFGGSVTAGLDFSYPVTYYTTTLTPTELAKLVEPPKVWRPLSLAEVRLMQEVAKREGTHKSDRFRCKLYGTRTHQFSRWDFGSSATDYETTHTEQEIVNLL